MKTRISVSRTLGFAVAFWAAAFLLVPDSGSAAAWEPDVRLTQNSSASYVSHNNAHCVGCDTLGNVHTVWYENVEIEPGMVLGQVWYRKYNGAVWTGAVKISQSGEGGYTAHPTMVVEPGGVLHVVWKESRRVFYKKFDGTAWGTSVALTPSDQEAYTPSLAQDSGGNLHLVWCDSRDGNDEIYYKRFDGTTWGPDVRLTDAVGLSWNPAVACGPAGDIHVVWYDTRDGAAEIYYKLFDGTAWGQGERLTYAAVNAANPGIAVDPAGRVYVAWGDYRDGNNEIYAKSFDGTSWGADTRLTYASGTSWNPSVAVDDSGRVHVAWHDGRDGDPELYCKMLDGTAWGPDERVTAASGASENPSLAIGPNGDRHLVWHDYRNGNFEIYYKIWRRNPAPPPVVTSIAPQAWYRGEVRRATLAGKHFRGPGSSVTIRFTRFGHPDFVADSVKVLDPATIICILNLTSADPDVYDLVVALPDGQADTIPSGFAVERGWSDVTRLTSDPAASLLSEPGARCLAPDASGRLHLVWYDNRGGTNQVYYKCFDGVAWGADQCISSGLGRSEYPSVAVDAAGKVHVVWQTKVTSTNAEIYYAFFDGSVWQSPLRLTDRPYDSTDPSIAASSDGMLHVVWRDRPNNIEGQICYMSYDGTAWSSVAELTLQASRALLPSVATDAAGDVHVVWCGGASQAEEIYYRKSHHPSWGAEQRLTNNARISYAPSIATGPADRVHVAWRDNRDGYYAIFYKVCDGGIWGDDQRLIERAGSGYNQSISVESSGKIHVAWKDNRDATFEIYYKTFDGSAWGPDRRLTLTTTNSNNPFVVADAFGRVSLVWSDSNEGNSEIYYKYWDIGLGWSSIEDLPAQAPLGEVTSIYPNPLRSDASIAFVLARPATVDLSIYNAAGRLVWRATVGSLVSGEHRISWDGRDDRGARVAPGVYAIKIGTGTEVTERKMVVLR